MAGRVDDTIFIASRLCQSAIDMRKIIARCPIRKLLFVREVFKVFTKAPDVLFLDVVQAFNVGIGFDEVTKLLESGYSGFMGVVVHTPLVFKAGIDKSFNHVS